MKRSILAKNLTTGEVLFFETALEASKEFDFDESHIIKCCRGRRQKHKGYSWSYYLPLNTVEETVSEKAWSFTEDTTIKTYFESGDLSSLLERLPGRNFKGIICRAHILGLKRRTAQAKNVTPYDLINELAEDIFFGDLE